MKKFLFSYYGGVPTSQVSEKKRGQWFAWFDSIKEHIVDGGNPIADYALSVTSRGADPIVACTRIHNHYCREY